MKILTVNFLTCAVKACKTSPASFPLHFRDAELEQTEMEYSPEFMRNILPRVDWEALKVTAGELGFTTLPADRPIYPSAAAEAEGMHVDDETPWRELHTLLLETQVVSGKLVCGNCGHEYPIKEGIANFLLPNHLV